MADQNANARAETGADSRGRARSVSPDCSELPASFANDAISRRSRSQYADEIADDLDLIGIVQRREIHPRSVSSTPLLNIAPTWTALADQVEIPAAERLFILQHGEGTIDCVLKGEGEAGIVELLEAVASDVNAIPKVPGAVTANGSGPPPRFAEHLDDVRPARDLVRNRRKYFLGVLDPCGVCGRRTVNLEVVRGGLPEPSVNEHEER